ncbi:MAG: type III-A CRISPR-associated RAMP protein Csm5 [Deltaproteobacteria bacterium]|nr:type III-A CRISPR-associated RAMP protein Csm5 [Deltaproteobacteria bacterium]
MNNGIMRAVEVEGMFLSPVHVGWGNELDPFCSFMRGDRLYYFEMASVVQRFSERDRAEFLSLVEKNNLIEIRKFLNTRLDPSRDALASIAVSESVVREYSGKIDDPRNQLIFEPFFRNGNRFIPAIPGSSLKGAIRTAVIDRVLEDRHITLEGNTLRNPRAMESWVLGYRSMEADPFKALKVEDVDLVPGSTIIYHVFNYSPNRATLTNLGLRFEAARSYLDGGNLSFRTVLQFFEGFKDKTIRAGKDRRPAISMYIEPEFVLSACREFYLKNLHEEHERFYINSPYAEESRRLVEAASELSQDECLIRVGRFTQAESKSINRYRKVMVRGRGGRSRPMDFGTTRNLADGRYPMGWLKLRFIGLDLKKVGKTTSRTIWQHRKPERDKRKRLVSGTPTRRGSVDLSALKKKYKIKKQKP